MVVLECGGSENEVRGAYGDDVPSDGTGECVGGEEAALRHEIQAACADGGDEVREECEDGDGKAVCADGEDQGDETEGCVDAVLDAMRVAGFSPHVEVGGHLRSEFGLEEWGVMEEEG